MSLFPWTRHFRVPVATSSPQRTEYAHRLRDRHPRCQTATGPRQVRRTHRDRGRRTPSAGGTQRSSSRLRRRPASRSAPGRGRHPGPRSHAHPRPAPLHRPTDRHVRALRRGRCAARPGPAARAHATLLITREVDGRRPPTRTRPARPATGPHRPGSPTERDSRGHVQQHSPRIVHCPDLHHGARATDIVWSSLGRLPPARPQPGHRPRRGHAGRTRSASSPVKCLRRWQEQGLRQSTFLLARVTFRFV